MKKIIVEGKIREETTEAYLIEIIVSSMTTGNFLKSFFIWLSKSQIKIESGEICLPQWQWQAKYRGGRWRVSAREEDDNISIEKEEENESYV